MPSLTAEPISPELVLVCPELREEALALLPKLPWEQVASQTSEQVTPPETVATPYASALRESIAALLQLGQLAAIVLVATTLLTLGLTLAADFTR